MEILFLTVDEVLELHQEQIELFGGTAELRDMGLFQSAVAMPQTGFGGEYAHAFPHEMAAAYLFHIAANHPFVDGNKRTALDAALTFLEANDFHLDANPTEVGDLVIALAAGQLAKPAVIDFFKTHVKPR